MTDVSETKRDKLTRLFDTAKVNGVAYLLAISVLGSVTVQELMSLTGERDDTVRRYLAHLESRQLIMRVRVSKADRFHVTPAVAATLTLTLPGNLLPQKTDASPSSSSSDQLDQSSNLDQLDQIEEEDDTDRKFKVFLCERYGLTGERAALIISDDAITADDLGAWIYETHQMARRGFKFNKSPEAYATKCVIGHQKAPANARAECQATLDRYWEAFQATLESESDQP